MNVTRSTLMRRGFVLTALTVAVLLAGSSGSAWAQTIGFSTSRATLDEGASTDNATDDPLKVTIRRSGNFNADDGDSSNNNDDDPSTDQSFEDWVGANTNIEHVMIEAEYEGRPYDSGNFPFTITARSGDGTATTTVVPGTTSFGFRTEATRSDNVADRIELTIENTADPGDWNDEMLVLKVVATTALTGHLDERTVRYGTQSITVTIDDREKTRSAPRFRFKPTGIQLAKGNSLKMVVGVGTGANGVGDPSSEILTTLFGLDGVAGGTPDISDSGDDVLLSVDPADAVGRIVKIYKGDTAPPDDAATDLGIDSPGTYIVSKIGGDTGVVSSATANDSITLTIVALQASGFRDEQVSLTLMDGRTDSEKRGEGGPIDDSVPGTVTVLSGEETPTVTFSTDAVSIDEGESETVHILADTAQGGEVGSVLVRVRGDAQLSLEQGGSPISGGVVEFGNSANAELTIRAVSDPALDTGEENTATLTITDASGANIGDPRELMVTVVGSTAVPALPLVGQLLLALFLAAGGARLYRRRQQ